MRFTHTLKHNKGQEWPRYVTFFDVESDTTQKVGKRHIFRPFLWVACHVEWRKDRPDSTRIWQVGTDAAIFWDDVARRTHGKMKRYIVSHHLEADFLPLQGFTQLARCGFALEHIYKKGLTTILKFTRAGATLVAINNAQLIPGTIEDIGRMVGMDKLSMPPLDAPPEQWVEYCKRDVEVMVAAWHYLKQFIQGNNLGGFGLTRATVAKHAFCHRFMTHPITIHANQQALELEREAYHGGRVQAIQCGTYVDGPFYLLDVVSMYAYLQSVCDLPTKFEGWLESPTLEQVRRVRRRYGLIARVTATLSEPVLPQFVEGKVTYPVGVYRGTVTTSELDYILDKGWSLQVHNAAKYRLRPAFREFARFFMELKAQYEHAGNRIMRQFAKDIPNTLYGKFGQKSTDTKVIGACAPDMLRWSSDIDTVAGTAAAILYSGGQIKRITTSGASWDTFVAIPAHITANGRLLLWGYMKQAGWENIYHVATDSLLVNQRGYDNLAEHIKPDQPGELRIELQGQRLRVYGKNDWALDDQVRIKGVQKKARWVGPNQVINTNWPGIMAWVKGDPGQPYYTVECTKTLNRHQVQEHKEPNP
jgi:hypothetical protein